VWRGNWGSAGVTFELQQYNGRWSTIKTWSDADSPVIYSSTDWYVEKGYQYRLKLTHTAMNSNWTVIYSFINYSKTITYN